MDIHDVALRVSEVVKGDAWRLDRLRRLALYFPMWLNILCCLCTLPLMLISQIAMSGEKIYLVSILLTLSPMGNKYSNKLGDVWGACT